MQDLIRNTPPIVLYIGGVLLALSYGLAKFATILPPA